MTVSAEKRNSMLSGSAEMFVVNVIEVPGSLHVSNFSFCDSFSAVKEALSGMFYSCS